MNKRLMRLVFCRGTKTQKMVRESSRRESRDKRVGSAGERVESIVKVKGQRQARRVNGVGGQREEGPETSASGQPARKKCWGASVKR